VDEVDAVQHLGAGRAGQRLADAEQLLVLAAVSQSEVDGCISQGSETHHLLIDPFQLAHKLVVELQSRSDKSNG
jgi:hypothetical protein